MDLLARAAAIGAMSDSARVHEGAVRAHRHSNNTDFYRITNAKGENGQPARVELFDEIGFWGVMASDFARDIGGVTADTIHLHINSPGGDVFDGIAILNMVRSHPATVVSIVDGLAASAASFIAMGGDEVVMMPNATMMIHDASGLVMGNQADALDFAALLGKISDNIASVYAKRAGGDVADWREIMRGEQWYSDEEAVAAGLADRIGMEDSSSTKDKAKNSANAWNLSLFTYASRAEAPAPKAPEAARNLDLSALYTSVFNALKEV